MVVVEDEAEAPPTSSVLEPSEDKCVWLWVPCDDDDDVVDSLLPSPSDFSSELMGSRSESKPVG